MRVPTKFEATNMKRLWVQIGLVSVISLAATINLSAAQTGSASNDETAADVVATQIRAQGYLCKEPSDATRDQTASAPDEAVWILNCENATYRVRLVPDMAAQVEKLD